MPAIVVVATSNWLPIRRMLSGFTVLRLCVDRPAEPAKGAEFDAEIEEAKESWIGREFADKEARRVLARARTARLSDRPSRVPESYTTDAIEDRRSVHIIKRAE